MQRKNLKTKMFKKITLVLLLLTLVFTSITQAPVNAATKKTTTSTKKINKKFTLKTSTVKLQVGKTYQFKKALKNPVVSMKVSLKGYKVSYKSSNTKVATVSSKGKITAKKKGTATITIYYKKGNTTYYSNLKVQVIQKKSNKNSTSESSYTYEGNGASASDNSGSEDYLNSLYDDTYTSENSATVNGVPKRKGTKESKGSAPGNTNDCKGFGWNAE